MCTPSLGITKLETKNVSALNILKNIILYIIGMEIEYILFGYMLNFLFIRNGEVCVFIYVNNIERPIFFFSEAEGLVLRDPDVNYSFTTCCVTMNLTSLKFILFMCKVRILTSRCLYEH